MGTPRHASSPSANFFGSVSPRSSAGSLALCGGLARRMSVSSLRLPGISLRTNLSADSVPAARTLARTAEGSKRRGCILRLDFMQRTYEMSVDSSVATSSCKSVMNFWPTLMKPFFALAAGCSSRAVKRCLTSGLPTASASQRDE